MLILGLIFKMFWGRRGWGGHHGRMSYGVLFADKIRSMSEEEFTEFKKNYGNNSCYGHCSCGNCGCCGECRSKEKSEEKVK